MASLRPMTKKQTEKFWDKSDALHFGFTSTKKKSGRKKSTAIKRPKRVVAKAKKTVKAPTRVPSKAMPVLPKLPKF